MFVFISASLTVFFRFSESIKSVLGRHTKILVKYMVKLEYKTDKTENRVLVSVVVTPVCVYDSLPCTLHAYVQTMTGFPFFLAGVYTRSCLFVNSQGSDTH